MASQMGSGLKDHLNPFASGYIGLLRAYVGCHLLTL